MLAGFFLRRSVICCDDGSEIVTFLYISVSSRHLCFFHLSSSLLSPPCSSSLPSTQSLHLFPDYLSSRLLAGQVCSCLSSSISLLLCLLPLPPLPPLPPSLPPLPLPLPPLPPSLSPLFPCQHHYSLWPPHLVPPSILRLSLHSGLVYYLSPPCLTSPLSPLCPAPLSPLYVLITVPAWPGPVQPGPQYIALSCILFPT